MKLYSAEEAAAELGLHANTVLYHCREGNIEAEKIGRDWVITEEALEKFRKERRPPGRPRQS